MTKQPSSPKDNGDPASSELRYTIEVQNARKCLAWFLAIIGGGALLIVNIYALWILHTKFGDLFKTIDSPIKLQVLMLKSATLVGIDVAASTAAVKIFRSVERLMLPLLQDEYRLAALQGRFILPLSTRPREKSLPSMRVMKHRDQEQIMPATSPVPDLEDSSEG